MNPFTSFEGRGSPLPVNNIDTDRIIPARFLTTTEKTGYGRNLFADWKQGKDAATGAEILIVGNNFGCGSSREHAVWALLDAGIRVVLSTGFAEIFHANALRNGLVAVILESAIHEELMSRIGDDLKGELRIDLDRQIVAHGSFETSFDFDSFAKHCIMNGVDELGYLLEMVDAIASFERARTPRVNTRGGA